MKLMSCVLFFIVLVVTFHSTKISCQEVEDQSDFSYVQGSEDGPENWGNIYPKWDVCETGQMQSPIDLQDERIEVGTHLKKLKRSYRPTYATIINRGHDVMVTWIGGGGTIQINNIEYVLQQCHWHSPSEHTFNGKMFALELHMVHLSADNKIAVVGIIYTFGQPDTFLAELMEHIVSLGNTSQQEIPVGILNPNDIKMGKKYYRYVGSLTTPPCTENVVWTIVQKVKTVSREQVRLLRAAVNYESNARPVQEINQRSIYLYRPKDHEVLVSSS